MKNGKYIKPIIVDNFATLKFLLIYYMQNIYYNVVEKNIKTKEEKKS